MGGKGSGRVSAAEAEHRRRTAPPSDWLARARGRMEKISDRIAAAPERALGDALLRLGQDLARANRADQALVETHRDSLQLAMGAFTQILADNRALIHDLERSMARENELLNRPADAIAIEAAKRARP